jgi:hypothetical protein
MAECYCNDGYRIVPYTTTPYLDDVATGDQTTGHSPGVAMVGPGDAYALTKNIHALTAMWDLNSTDGIDNLSMTYSGTYGINLYIEGSMDKIRWYDGKYHSSYNNGQTSNSAPPWVITPHGGGGNSFTVSGDPGFLLGFRFIRLTVWDDETGHTAGTGSASLTDFRVSYNGTGYTSGGSTSTLTNPNNVGTTIIY